MHLSLLISHGVSPHTIGQWRLPGSYSGFRYDRPAYWEHIARTAERACFDMVFLSDSYGVFDRYRNSDAVAIRYAVQYPHHDPLPLIPIMARVTENLGLVATGSTTFLPPYWLARHLATLDHLTEGRVGWNVVTTADRSAARQFGLVDLPDHQARYAEADEYLRLCLTLWDSWDEDAVAPDRETGVFADPEKIRRIDFQGERFRSAGQFCVPRSPQGRPLIAQAGSSAPGLQLCARYADVSFAIRHSIPGMREHMARLEMAVDATGRPPGSTKVLWGILPIIGRTRDEARDRQAAILENVTVEAGLTMLSGKLGIDLSQFDPQRPFPNLDATNGIQGHLDMIEGDFPPQATLGDIARQVGAGIAPHIVGTPADIADQLEARLDAGGGHGFMIVTHALPGSITDFADLVVPELQRRGLFRRSYREKQLVERFAAIA